MKHQAQDNLVSCKELIRFSRIGGIGLQTWILLNISCLPLVWGDLLPIYVDAHLIMQKNVITYLGTDIFCCTYAAQHHGMVRIASSL